MMTQDDDDSHTKKVNKKIREQQSKSNVRQLNYHKQSNKKY